MLYEVITILLKFTQFTPFPASLYGYEAQKKPAIGKKMANTRITSYNVCYTKLLRDDPVARLQAVLGGIAARRDIDDQDARRVCAHVENAAQVRREGHP